MPEGLRVKTTACPSDEWLVAYLTAGLSAVEGELVGTHARACVDCARALQTVAARLRIADEIAVPVPLNLRQRIAPASPAPQARGARGRSVWRDLRDRMSAILRQPLLIPMAAAALLLVFFGVQQRDTDQVRSVPRLEEQTTLHIGAREALVRNQPTTRGDVVATLNRGAVVTYRGEDRDWYRVTMADGSEGWIEREALDR